MHKINNIKYLKDNLDNLYNEFEFEDRIAYDPIEFPHKFSYDADKEIAGFIAASFAYGRIDLFKPIIKKILTVMGNSPYDFLLNFNMSKHKNLFVDIKYRFSNNNDILSFIFILHKIILSFQRLENLFKKNYSIHDPNIENALKGFIKAFEILNSEIIHQYSDGFSFFFPNPERGSSCKRLNLFLRWMIRDRDIDLGVWKGIPKNKLVIPLDTHIARISRCLGFTKRKSTDWKMAVEITESLKIFDPEDPLKYDFALCHQGVTKLCSEMRCRECRLRIISNSVK